MGRKSFAVYRLLDCEPDIAVIRYDGDPDVFTALAWAWMAEQEAGYSMQPPERPELLRLNVINDYEYSWRLARSSRRGPGVFVGAILKRARRMEGGW